VYIRRFVLTNNDDGVQRPIAISERSDFLGQKKKLPLFRKRDRFTKEHSHADLKDVPHTCLQILGSKGQHMLDERRVVSTSFVLSRMSVRVL